MAPKGETHKDGRPIVEAKDLETWRDWLSANHAESEPVWVTNSKQGGEVPAVSYLDARDEALCWGWVDSTVNRLDEHRYLTMFARRNPKSGWSKVNKEKVAELRESGRMKEPGEASIATAVENGSWALLDAIEALEAPDDLLEALSSDPVAGRGYESMPPGMKKELLRKVILAKRPETRAKWIRQGLEDARRRGGEGGSS